MLKTCNPVHFNTHDIVRHRAGDRIHGLYALFSVLHRRPLYITQGTKVQEEKKLRTKEWREMEANAQFVFFQEQFSNRWALLFLCVVAMVYCFLSPFSSKWVQSSSAVKPHPPGKIRRLTIQRWGYPSKENVSTMTEKSFTFILALYFTPMQVINQKSLKVNVLLQEQHSF